MSIPTLCQACYKHYRSTVVKACPFCRDVQFPEQVLCDLVQEGQSEKLSFRCAAFQPALSVVQPDHTDAEHAEEGSEDTVNMSPKDKWFQAYAVQQLSLHPDLIDFTIRYHVVLSTRQRTNVFSSEHGEQIGDMVRQAALSFEQTTAHVLWLASDHLHLYIDATPDYALDEIVHAIREYLEHEMANLLPALPHSNQPAWERAYFAEGIEFSLSRLNHGQPGVQAHPEIMQGTADLHHEIADALLPQADPVFHNPTPLDAAVDVLDPEPPLVERLVGQVLLQGQLRTAGLLRRHEDFHLGERERQEAQILQQPTSSREGVGGGLRDAQIMGAAAVGIAQRPAGH
jgi:REP element-mobilizing transposase RayT